MASGKALQSTVEIAGVLSPSLENAIRQAVANLEDMSEETLKSVGAAEKLSAEISTQESVLKSLQKGYADYVVSGQESSAEARTLAGKIQDLSDELDENRETLLAAEKAADRLTDTQDNADDAFTRLEKTIEDQKEELEKLNREYANVVLEQGKTSQEAQQLESKIRSLSGELDDNERKLKDVGIAAENAGDDVEDSADGYTVLKDAIGDLVADALSYAIDAFKELGIEGDKTLGLLQARTGAATGKMLKYEDVMNNVYNAGYGESFEEVGDTMGVVIQMFGDMDDVSLENITKNAIAMNDIFGFDTAETLRAVNSLMDKFGITADEAYNLIVQGAQNGLNQNGDMMDVINEYAPQFEAAGFTADEMFNMLVNGAEAGTWSVDKLGDAVKEYNIRMSDGTAAEALMDNYKALGMTKDEAQELSKAFGAGGDVGAAAMKNTLDAIMAIEDETERYQLGVAMFGTMWEDLGEDAVYALFNTEGAIDSTNEAMSEADAAAYDNLGIKFRQLGRTIKSHVFTPLVKKLTPALGKAVDYVTNNVGPAVEWILDHLPEIGIALGTLGAVIAAMKWGSIVGKIKKVSGVIKGLMTAFSGISGPALIVIGIIAALAAGFVYLWKTNEDFRSEMMGLWEQLQGTFSELGGTFMDMLDQILPVLGELGGALLVAFGDIAAAVIPALLELVISILPVLIDLINTLLPVITMVIMAVLPILVDLIEALLPVVVQIIETVLPVLVDLINQLLPVFLQIIEAVLPILVQLIEALLPIITQIIEAVLPILVELLNVLMPIFELLISLLQPILDLFIAILQPILDLILLAITPLIDILTLLVTMAIEPLIPQIEFLGTMFSSYLTSAIETVTPIIEALKTYLGGLITFITGVFAGDWESAWSGIVEMFGGLWDGLVALVKAPINGVIALVNSAIDGLNSISVTIPDWVPKVGGSTFGVDIPKIPMLAKGGFTDGISIAGEEGMEAVISFDSAYRDKNIGIWEKAGRLLGVLGNEEQNPGLTAKAGHLLTLDDFSLGSLADTGGVVIYYDFSGLTWSPQIQKDNSEDEDGFMARLKAHEAEFFEWLEEFIRMREVAEYA